MELKKFIKISPGFKSAVNLEKELENLQKVSGYIPGEVSREVILDFAKKLHPTASNRRSRLIMGTYGTGKSHLALVIANLFRMPADTPEIQSVLEKLDYDTRELLVNNRKAVNKKFLIVRLYGDEGRISDAFMMSLRRSLEEAGLEHLLPDSAFDAAIDRIEEVKESFPENYTILKEAIEKKGLTLNELTARLKNYERNAFDIFCTIHPSFSGGSRFVYSTMLEPATFYNSVIKELADNHDYEGIAVFWDEFGHKMEEVVKDPSGKEGIDLQEFAESCNYSEEYQLHLYLFCHRSLKEYQDISKSGAGIHDSLQQREDDLRKIEGRFKPFILKNTSAETFRLISSVIITDENSVQWKHLTDDFSPYFDSLSEQTSKLNYFIGYPREKLKSDIVLGTYPLHPMTVFCLPELSEKVAQNNRTLFTCLCEDDMGSLYRYINKTVCDPQAFSPPMFTVDMLWEYFSEDVKQQERTSSVYRDYRLLSARLNADDDFGQRLLKSVCVFQIVKPTRFKVTSDILEYSLNIYPERLEEFHDRLQKLSDHRDENRILTSLTDGSYRPAIIGMTESLYGKISKLVANASAPDSPLQKPIAFLNSIWKDFSVAKNLEVTRYWDEFGVKREFVITPVSLWQLKESLHLLTKNLGAGEYIDGILLIVMCADSRQIEDAKKIASEELAQAQYRQLILAVPKQPVSFFDRLMQYQALVYLKKQEGSLYGESGELHEEWSIWFNDIFTQLTNDIEQLINPENRMLEYCWKGVGKADIINRRKLKDFTDEVMQDVFPHSPYIGDDKLAMDDFSRNWGYRKECRDIVFKLTKHGAAEELIKESASAPKHVINQLLMINGILSKNQAGEAVIGRPSEDQHSGAAKVWDCIDSYLKKVKKGPVSMGKMVKQLRNSPYGVKCRIMPILFAAVAHSELSLGNLSFEFSRTAKKIEKISSFENDTLEKVFISPEKYKLVYVNVSSDQNELIAGLAKVFSINLESVYLPLERVQKVGENIGAWWRGLSGYAQITENISDEAAMLRDHVFRPLAQIEPDIEKILLQDIFKEVFKIEGEAVKRQKVTQIVQPIREEFENTTEQLRNTIYSVCSSVFSDNEEEGDNGASSLSKWFHQLDEEKRNFIFHGDAGTLIAYCREGNDISESTILSIAEKITGMKTDNWSDELVLIFKGKLDSAKKYIETHKSAVIETNIIKETPETIEPNKIKLTIASKDGFSDRIFEVTDSLSQNAQIMENLLNNTVESIERSLNDQEKMYVFYRFVKKNIFGESP